MEVGVKKLLLGAIAVAFATSATAQTVYVQPHVRQDGTYVPGHYRTAPNSSKADNWSSKPNVNPHNGREGRVDPNEPRPSQSRSTNRSW